MKILNLKEKIYVESVFIGEKSHLLRNEIDKIIYHQGSNDGLKRLQQLPREQQMTYLEYNTYLTGSSCLRHNLPMPAYTDQPMRWNMEVRSIFHRTQNSVRILQSYQPM